MADYTPPPPITPNFVDPREYKADQLKKFLEKISAIESSSGQDLNHKELKHGMHAGTAAVGEYGVMPLTAQDIDRQSGVNELAGLYPEEVSARLEQDPDLYNRLAQTMASKLLAKNNQEKAAYKWEHGQYSNPTPEQVSKAEYVRKFKVLDPNRKLAGK